MSLVAMMMSMLAFLLGSIIQDVPEVPNAVKHAFARNFDVPAEVSWKKNRSGYEVDFVLADVAHAARYTVDGDLLMVKMALDEQDLPPLIQQRIADGFRQFAIVKVDQVKAGDRLFIQIALESKSQNRKVVFTPDGEIDQTFPYWN